MKLYVIVPYEELGKLEDCRKRLHKFLDSLKLSPSQDIMRYGAITSITEPLYRIANTRYKFTFMSNIKLYLETTRLFSKAVYLCKYLYWLTHGKKMYRYRGYHCGCCGAWVAIPFKIPSYISEGYTADTIGVCQSCIDDAEDD
jgi:hypothetical protein